MKEFPSIPSSLGYHGRSCSAFYKYDGSNLRFGWTRKAGWNKQGTRTRLFDETDSVFGGAIKVFKDNFADKLEQIFKRDKLIRSSQSAIAFFEYFGPNSFAGQHKDEPKELVLLDVNIHKKGLMCPNDFVATFSTEVKTAELVYKGILTKEFEHLVRSGGVPGLNEGVVCKAGSGEDHDRWACKIKTDAYREKLKAVYADGWEKFWE